MTAKKAKKIHKPTWHFPLERNNLILIGIGIVVILIGYLLMSTGISEEPAGVSAKWNNPMAVSIAPILLVIGYCVIIPYAIYRTFSKKSAEKAAE